ncbi:MAG: four helix bundle protein [Bacteroidota bacterium]|nr:four helix bundle protein [Bacteroidota bacterium]
MKNGNVENNPILKLTFEFALAVIKYCEVLEDKKKYVLSRQLLKSGTSIGANSREAQNAESKPDFIHKFKIAAKEVDETQYWLSLCKYSTGYPNCDELLKNLDEIDKVITKIISSSKTSMR